MDTISPQSDPGAGHGADEVDEELGSDWGGAWSAEGMLQEVNSIHAQHVTAVTSQATSAAWHADIAAKQAANLAQWVQYLWGQVATLQHKVTELEDWKRNALDDMSKLRMDHKVLRRKVMKEGDVAEEEDVPPAPKAKSMPNIDSAVDVVEESFIAERKPGKAVTVAAVHPPPGIDVALDDSPLEGVHVERMQIEGAECERAEWRIGHLSAKLKNCMGRALVSSPFSAWGLDDLRLMVFPDGKEVPKGPRSKRQKDQYSKKVFEGPLEACLKLKVPDCPAPHVLEYYLKIGDIRKGPFKHNFAESTVNGCSDFGIDWLKQVDGDQSLTVTVDIMQAKFT